MSSDDVVVDASLAVKWVLLEPFSAEARSLLGEWQERGLRLIAPPLILYEITNALSKRLRRRELRLEDATELAGFFVEGDIQLIQHGGVHSRALEVTAHFGLPSSYDANYLALAELQDCECWTADERLWNSVKRKLDWVRWIGERALK